MSRNHVTALLSILLAASTSWRGTNIASAQDQTKKDQRVRFLTTTPEFKPVTLPSQQLVITNLEPPNTSGCASCHLGLSQSSLLFGMSTEAAAEALGGRGAKGGGAKLSQPDDATRALLGLTEGGLVVEQVCPKKRKQLGGLTRYDVILKLNGESVQELEKVNKALTGVNDDLTLDVMRAGKPVTVTIKSAADDDKKTFRIGVSLGELEPVVRSQLELDETVSVYVTEVVPESPAAGAGIKAHDILVTVDAKPIPDGSALQKAVRDSKGRELKLVVVRARKRLTLKVVPKAHKSAEAQARLNINDLKVDLQTLLPPNQVINLSGINDQNYDLTTQYFTPYRYVGQPAVSSRLKELDRKLDELKSVVEELRKELKSH